MPPSSPESASRRPDVAVLVPAGGSGVRMGGTRKQFRLLAGRPLLVRTLQIFDAQPRIARLIVAVPTDAVDSTAALLAEAGLESAVDVVAGGASRQGSVARALAAVPVDLPLVLVHDAVRPFVESEQIAAVIDAADRTGAAALAVPLADTLRRVENGRFGETLPREGVYRMQTPQAFRTDWLREAHDRARADGRHATDDVALVLALGRAVSWVAGSALNFKVTTPADWELARQIVQLTKDE